MFCWAFFLVFESQQFKYPSHAYVFGAEATLSDYSGSFSERFSENLDKLAFFAGVVLSFVGFVTINGWGTLVSAVSLFSGILLVFLGLFSLLGLFPHEWRTVNGVAVLLVCVAVALLAFALVSFEFLKITHSVLSPIYPHGASPNTPPLGYQVIISTDRAYAWLSGLCFYVGLGSLVFGAGLKIVEMLRR